MIAPANRLARLPAYIFARLDELKLKAAHDGVDLIDLGLGNPDGPTPQPIVHSLKEAASNPQLHGYPPFAGLRDFKEAVAYWMFDKYGVTLNPQNEILPLLGSKEGLAHLFFAYLDQDDIALIPNPCYPVHRRATILAGGLVHDIPLTRENHFLPSIQSIPDEVAAQAKILVLNYPNNPTSAVAPKAVLEEALAFARRHQILLVHDLAYGELFFDGQRPTSLMELPGAKDVAVEFHTLSKTFNMAGWRIGFAVGNETVIKTLYALKTNVDYGVFAAIQKAGITALKLPDVEIDTIRNTYRQRRDFLAKAFASLGFDVTLPSATMYFWLPIPMSINMTSTEYAEALISRTGVVVTPGAAFGEHGEGYIRVSMVAQIERLKEAMGRWQGCGLTA